MNFQDILKLAVGNIGVLNSFFGGKPWYRSTTGWGIALYFGVSAGVEQLCQPGGPSLLSPGLCATIQPIVETAGLILMPLGIRKAATSKNVA